MSNQGRKSQREATINPDVQLSNGRYPMRNDAARIQRTPNRWKTGLANERKAIPSTATPRISSIEANMS
jgi:hypothetical protein